MERRTHCRNGHERTPENVREVLRPYKDGQRIVRECRLCQREGAARRKREAVS